MGAQVVFAGAVGRDADGDACVARLGGDHRRVAQQAPVGVVDVDRSALAQVGLEQPGLGPPLGLAGEGSSGAPKTAPPPSKGSLACHGSIKCSRPSWGAAQLRRRRGAPSPPHLF
jgi:hypothetical protein